MKKSKKRVIPGFGLTMGVTITMLSIIVLIPLASLVVYSSQLGLKEFFEVITRKRVLSSFYVSFITALGASLVNAVMGLILAWVLVRYEFPGKRIMDGMIELPFALPTAGSRYFAHISYSRPETDWKFFCKIRYQDRLYQTWYYICIDFCWNSVCSKSGTACS